jgi:hypothetical protein
MVNSVNSAAGRKTQPLTVRTGGRNARHSDGACRHSGERFSKTKLLLNFVLAIATVGAFVAATVYAYFASQQVTEMKNAVKEQSGATNAAIEANLIAHQNAVQDLRAYVSVGTPQGESIDVLRDASPKPTIRIHFTNTGRTPARHFSFLLWSNLKQGTWLSFRDASYGGGSQSRSENDLR